MAARVGEADDETRDDVAAVGAIENEHPLLRAVRAAEHVAHFESHTETRAGGVRDQQIARVQPRDIAIEDLPFRERGFGGLDVVLEQMPGQDRVAAGLEVVYQLAQRRNRAAVTAHRASEIDPQASLRELPCLLPPANSPRSAEATARALRHRDWRLRHVQHLDFDLVRVAAVVAVDHADTVGDHQSAAQWRAAAREDGEEVAVWNGDHQARRHQRDAAWFDRGVLAGSEIETCRAAGLVFGKRNCRIEATAG